MDGENRDAAMEKAQVKLDAILENLSNLQDAIELSQRPGDDRKSAQHDLITPDNASIEVLHGIFSDALMEVSIDEEHGFIRIREDIVAKVSLHESRDRIGIIAFYGIKEDTQRIDRLELANRINDQYVMVRACIEDEGDLCFDYTIVIKGGVTRKFVAHATRQFLKLVPRAVSECDEDGIVE